ncbi:50S ribosomal protein L9 [Pseudodesulfovibrio senegalensis]|jgi:large subunit ribosomal protein L9|uniref:Large ribosomal subunit protein bL9 n=1 Tax=Pseudodesulfovibrio senegalensis TaxID=1721087 RepID=A0A6N6N5D6_9BACT|nr:50S ribosomal protein L9 [Pseudodesulfovibrio senegalensis]KAB1443440.1 50S ribosomal protein L9 [Pseudodesulfovibrio senegalensis]
MKLILRADVDSLGRLGDVVTVKAGYGRNYLVPQGLAMPASKANVKQFELERKKLQVKADALRAVAQELAEKVAATPVSIAVRVGEGDKLYGAVTAANIADAMAEAGVEIDRRKILLSDPIRSLGEFDIEIKLHPEVRGELKLAVVKHGQPADEEPVEETAEEAPVAEEAEATADAEAESAEA